MRANWFVAFPVPAGEWLEEARATMPDGLRPFAPEDLHATIAFLGPVSEVAARTAWEIACTRAPAAVPATLGEVVPMGGRRWSALSALFVEGDRALAEATLAMRAPVLAAAGARPDDRPPKPHVTIARPLRRAAESERRGALAWAAALDLGAPAVLVDRIALYTWSVDRRERLFRAVEEARLGGPRPE